MRNTGKSFVRNVLLVIYEIDLNGNNSHLKINKLTVLLSLSCTFQFYLSSEVGKDVKNIETIFFTKVTKMFGWIWISK